MATTTKYKLSTYIKGGFFTPISKMFDLAVKAATEANLVGKVTLIKRTIYIEVIGTETSIDRYESYLGNLVTNYNKA